MFSSSISHLFPFPLLLNFPTNPSFHFIFVFSLSLVFCYFLLCSTFLSFLLPSLYPPLSFTFPRFPRLLTSPLMSSPSMQFHPFSCHHCLFLVTRLCTRLNLISTPTSLLPHFLPPVARCCRSTSPQVCTSWALSAGSWPSACSSSSPSSTSASGKESRRLER